MSLTFDAQAMPGEAAPGGVPWGAVGPESVVVTRRLHRDGTSEYLLGGVPCRLRDIVDFFLGTGIGTKAYSIIEQGRIGFIVSSRPEDRRGLIDEAAGITKYKAKKKLAERRMEATKQHLLRVGDILGELDSRLRSLRIQAQKAERYKRYKSELRDLELWSASQRYLGLLAEEKSLTASSSTIADEHGQAESGLVREESEVEAERLALTEELTELGAAKEELFALSNKADLGAQRAQHYMDEARSLAERAQAARAEVEDLERRAQAHGGEIADLGGRLSQLDTEAEARQQAWQQLDSQHDELRSHLVATRQRLDRATADAAGALPAWPGWNRRSRPRRPSATTWATGWRPWASRTGNWAPTPSGRRASRRMPPSGWNGCASASRSWPTAGPRPRRGRRRSSRIWPRGDRARYPARGIAPPALAAAIAQRDSVALRELPAWRAGDHEAVPRRDHLPRRCGRRQSAPTGKTQSVRCGPGPTAP